MNISLESGDQAVKKKQPKRILHFSDGILEEYSTDEEEDNKPPPPPTVDPKKLPWLPWFWYYVVTAATRSLSAADFCGEKLAWFFGITSPKYQYAIDEYYRLKEEEEREAEREERRKQQLEEMRLSSINVQTDKDVLRDVDLQTEDNVTDKKEQEKF